MNFNNFSIRTKLILLLSLSAFLALSISMVGTSYSIFNSQKKDSLDNLRQMAHISGRNVVAALTFDDPQSAKKTLKPLGIDKNIQMALVYNLKGELFASYFLDKTQEQKADYKELKDVEKGALEVITWEYMSVTAPILLDEESIGHIKIIADTQELQSKVLDQVYMMSIIAFMSVLIIILFSFAMQKIFTEPIISLIKIMNRVSQTNEYDVPVECSNNDEFKELYAGFSTMLEKIDLQNKKIDAIHQQTRDSIEYSAGIQRAVLPKEEEIKKFFDDSFTFWEPKDTVGGDIYLFQTLRHEDEALLMVIDCTGHGVPGAFVTMIVKAIEKEIVASLNKSDYEVSPAIIMSYFNKSMKELLGQNSLDADSNAGFDGGVLYINKREKVLKFAGSQTPLFVVQNDTLRTIKGDKQSVGYKKSKLDYQYTEHSVDLSMASSIYLTTDGYLDQTGGEKGFLFGKKRFGALVHNSYRLPFSQQLQLFKNTFDTYKKDQETKDDTTLVAFHLNLGETDDS